MGDCIIEESGMKFGKYKEENVYEIEKSKQYCDKLRQRKIKCCEFILLRNNKLHFIEAKTKCPNRNNKNSKADYEKYIEEIVEKMRDSLMLYTAIILNIHNQKEIPQTLLQNNLSNRKIVLLLVVKNAEKDWLVHLREVITNRLMKEKNLYRIESILVINEEQARKRHLIV